MIAKEIEQFLRFDPHYDAPWWWDLLSFAVFFMFMVLALAVYTFCVKGVVSPFDMAESVEEICLFRKPRKRRARRERRSEESRARHAQQRLEQAQARRKPIPTLYHGTPTWENAIDIFMYNRFKDLGVGFCLTTDFNFACNYAKQHGYVLEIRNSIPPSRMATGKDLSYEPCFEDACIRHGIDIIIGDCYGDERFILVVTPGVYSEQLVSKPGLQVVRILDPEGNVVKSKY